MGLEYKPDFDEAAERVEAWWRGEELDRVPLKVMAPIGHVPWAEPAPEELEAWWTDPDRVIPRMEAQLASVYWGGDAVPVGFAVSGGMVAIMSAYLGCPYRFTGTTTAWADPIIENWQAAPPMKFDPDNKWWRATEALLGAAAERAPGRYVVGLPDLNGPGEILARLRGTEQLLFDVIENPAPLKPALQKLNSAWRRYHRACLEVVNRRVPGSVTWMGIWSATDATDLQCDFSCMISPAMFDDLFLSPLREQTEWVGRTLYHLDGPDAVRHLGSLLALERMSGIQWVPGAGARPMSEWVDLLRRILDAGKLLYIACTAREVEGLLKALPHRGLLLETWCGSRRDADALLANVARWCRARRGK